MMSCVAQPPARRDNLLRIEEPIVPTNTPKEAVADATRALRPLGLARKEAFGLRRQERLMFELLNARAGAYVGATELVALAFGIFDEAPDRRRLDQHMRKIQQRADPDSIERDPQRGFRMRPPERS